jgi:hypothetical protein
MSNLISKEMHPKDIATVLHHMADLVEAGDSYEGSIEYLLPDPPEWVMRGEDEPPGWEHRDYRLVGEVRLGTPFAAPVSVTAYAYCVPST